MDGKGPKHLPGPPEQDCEHRGAPVELWETLSGQIPAGSHIPTGLGGLTLTPAGQREHLEKLLEQEWKRHQEQTEVTGTMSATLTF